MIYLSARRLKQSPPQTAPKQIILIRYGRFCSCGPVYLPSVLVSGPKRGAKAVTIPSEADKPKIAILMSYVAQQPHHMDGPSFRCGKGCAFRHSGNGS